MIHAAPVLMMFFISVQAMPTSHSPNVKVLQAEGVHNEYTPLNEYEDVDLSDTEKEGMVAYITAEVTKALADDCALSHPSFKISGVTAAQQRVAGVGEMYKLHVTASIDEDVKDLIFEVYGEDELPMAIKSLDDSSFLDPCEVEKLRVKFIPNKEEQKQIEDEERQLGDHPPNMLAMMSVDNRDATDAAEEMDAPSSADHHIMIDGQKTLLLDPQEMANHSLKALSTFTDSERIYKTTNDIPADFDALAGSQCKSKLNARSQGSCNTCASFAGTTMMSLNFCKANKVSPPPRSIAARSRASWARSIAARVCVRIPCLAASSSDSLRSSC